MQLKTELTYKLLTKCNCKSKIEFRNKLHTTYRELSPSL